MHLPNTLGPSWCSEESRRFGEGQDSVLHSMTAQHTHVRQLSTAFERMNQTYSTAIGTHGSARHFDLTFIDSQAMVAVDVCIAGGMATMLSGAITCSNIVGELWRNPMLTTNAISRLSHHAKWEFFKLSRSQRI